jgi:hypothetical protein
MLAFANCTAVAEGMRRTDGPMAKLDWKGEGAGGPLLLG